MDCTPGASKSRESGDGLMESCDPMMTRSYFFRGGYGDNEGGIGGVTRVGIVKKNHLEACFSRMKVKLLKILSQKRFYAVKRTERHPRDTASVRISLTVPVESSLFLATKSSAGRAMQQ